MYITSFHESQNQNVKKVCSQDLQTAVFQLLVCACVYENVTHIQLIDASEVEGQSNHNVQLRVATELLGKVLSVILT